MKKLFALSLMLLLMAGLVLLPALAQAAVSIHIESGENAPDAPGSSYRAPVSTYQPPLFVIPEPGEGPKRKMNILFFVDSTGSMRSYMDSVRSNLFAFADTLSTRYMDVQFCLLDFKDMDVEGKDQFAHIHPLDTSGSLTTNHPQKLKRALDALTTGGGGDTPESALDAYNLTAPDYTTSGDAETYVFLITDAKDKMIANPDSSDYDVLLRLMRVEGVHASVISKNAHREHYRSLYEQTGGLFIDLDSLDYYKEMLNIFNVSRMKDSDRDGLPDEWEINGVDTDHDGVIDLPLNRMGADPNFPDLFVEVDWMYQPAYTSYFLFFPIKHSALSMRPSDEALQDVVRQFYKHQIHLHIDAGPNSVMNYETGERWGALSCANTLPYQSNFDLGDGHRDWNHIALDNFEKTRWHAFRHCLFVNRYNSSGSTGISEIGGQLFLVADVRGGGPLGILANRMKTSGTFMHELGHTLGLLHGGDENTQHKPNYLSVMNYLFQLGGLYGVKDIDRLNYSDYVLPAIDENHIDETKGIDPHGRTKGSGLGTKWLDKEDGNYVTAHRADDIAAKPINFNRKGLFPVYEKDIQFDLNKDGLYTVLNASINDWDHLVFAGGSIGGMGRSLGDPPVFIRPDSEIAEEISLEEFEKAGLCGNPGDCVIVSAGPENLFTGTPGQQIEIRVKNLYPEKTQALLSVQAPGLLAAAEKSVELDKNAMQTVLLPVSDAVKPGTYTVSCALKMENGETCTLRQDVLVSEMEALKLAVGEKQRFEPEEGLTVLSLAPSIVKVEDGQVIGVSAGETQLELRTDSGSLLARIPAAVQEDRIVLLAQPEDMTVTAGQQAAFSVKAQGEGLRFQWMTRKDGQWVDLPGAEEPDLILPAASLEDDGLLYACRITNAAGKSITSDAAVLHVQAVPVLPQTGDASRPGLLLLLGLVSTLALVLTKKKKTA